MHTRTNWWFQIIKLQMHSDHSHISCRQKLCRASTAGKTGLGTQIKDKRDQPRTIVSSSATWTGQSPCATSSSSTWKGLKKASRLCRRFHIRRGSCEHTGRHQIPKCINQLQAAWM